MVRHKAIKAALDVGKATEWNDDHEADYTSGTILEADFCNSSIAAKFDTAQTSGGSAPVVVLYDHHAMAYLDTGATTNNISSMRMMLGAAAGNITYVDDAPIMDMQVGLAAFHTAGIVAEFGMIKSDTAAAFTANQNGAYFRVNANKLYAVTGTGAAETATDVTPAGGISTWQHYRIELTGTTCKFYIGDMETAVATSTTNLPADDMTIKFSMKSQNNVDSKMYVGGAGLLRNLYWG